MIGEEVDQREYYRARIERFLELKGDGYEAWERECPLQAGEGAQ